MAPRKKYDAVATVGEYTDRQTGEKKKRYLNVGTLFENDEGKLSLKLDAVPCSPTWSGYIQFFEPQRDRGPDLPPGRRASPGMPVAPREPEPRIDEPDDPPF